jgi:hypothetical protein
MKKVLMVAVITAFVSVISGFAEEAATCAPAKKEAAKTGCSTCSACKKVESADGKCGGKDKASCKILSIQDGVATACACGKDCAKCGEVKDGKCACGKSVMKCDLKGKFVCEKCSVVADKAGKCSGCGVNLVEVKAKEEPAK